MSNERDVKGFRIFGRVESINQLPVRAMVKESSIAFEGPHVWLFLTKLTAEGLPNDENSIGLHLDVPRAEKLAGMLIEFAYEARAGNLTEKEPAEENP